MNHAIKNSCQLLNWKCGDILEVKDDWIEKIVKKENKQAICGYELNDLIYKDLLMQGAEVMQSVFGTSTSSCCDNRPKKQLSKTELEINRISDQGKQIKKDFEQNQEDKQKIMAQDKVLEYIKSLKGDDKYLKDITENYSLAKIIKQNIEVNSIEGFMGSMRKFVDSNC